MQFITINIRPNDYRQIFRKENKNADEKYCPRSAPQICRRGVPLYLSEYMEKCVDSLLVGGDRVEIIIINDGSKDRTGEIAEDIAAYLQETPCAVSEALEAIMEPISLYDPIYGENGDSLYVMDQIRDEDCNDDVWLENIAVAQALKKLSDRERSIIAMRFFRGKTQMEVASEIGISQAQVSRIEKSALERIRKEL